MKLSSRKQIVYGIKNTLTIEITFVVLIKIVTNVNSPREQCFHYVKSSNIDIYDNVFPLLTMVDPNLVY